MGGFCAMVELAQGGSVTKGAKTSCKDLVLSLHFYKTVKLQLFASTCKMTLNRDKLPCQDPLIGQGNLITGNMSHLKNSCFTKNIQLYIIIYIHIFDPELYKCSRTSLKGFT